MNSINVKINDIQQLLSFMGTEMSVSEGDKARIGKIKELCRDIETQSTILKEVITLIGTRNGA